MTERAHDSVVFGATGFTGGLTAEYLARAANGTRWAIAGRSQDKLERVRERLAAIDPRRSRCPRPRRGCGGRGLDAAAARVHMVVITTVGPYSRHGEPVVAACARAGTHCVDLTGEPEFVDDGTFFGGTLHSAVHVMSRLRQGRQVAGRRRRLEATPVGRTVKGINALPHPDDTAGGWIIPAPTIDPTTVVRSARSLDRYGPQFCYGPQFSYGHYIVAKRLPVLVAAGIGLAAVSSERVE